MNYDYRNLFFEINSNNLLLIDREGIILDSNASFHKLFETSNQDSVGKGIFSFFKDSSFQIELKEFITSLNPTWTTIQKWVSKNGYISTLKWNFKKTDNTVISCCGENITEFTIAKEALDRKTNEFDQFSYVVSHDLKAPLRAINSLVGFLEEDMVLEDLTSEIQENFDLIKGRVDKMQILIEGVLEYSQVSRLNKHKVDIDVKDLLNRLVLKFSEFSGFQINVSVKYATVFFNEELLTKVFYNLIENAIKFHDKQKGEITIAYSDKNDNHTFYISDDGPGISPAYHRKIFGMFQVLDNRKEEETFGIGLSIVKKIIEDNGGQIHIESEEQQGAKFIIYLPKFNQ